MNAKLIIILVLSFSYGFFETFMAMRTRRKEEIVESGDKGSLWILYISITLGYFFSFSIGATRLGRIFYWDAFFAAGMVLVMTGLIIRLTSIKTLKQHFTYTVTKIHDHELIQSGLYRWIRHPGYLGQLLVFVGLAAALSNWLSIVFMIIPIMIGYSHRIKIEEEFMASQLGENYREYQKRTKKMIPGIY